LRGGVHVCCGVHAVLHLLCASGQLVPQYQPGGGTDNRGIPAASALGTSRAWWRSTAAAITRGIENNAAEICSEFEKIKR